MFPLWKKKNWNEPKKSVSLILTVALLGFQYVYSLHCLMLNIEVMLIKPPIAFNLMCPLIG